MKEFLLNVLKLLVLLILPFILLIRGAVYFHEYYKWLPWLALFGGVVLSALMVFVYIAFIHGYFSEKSTNLLRIRNQYLLAVVMVLLYCLPSVFFLSEGNAKYPEVRKEFTALHPILRLSISTLVFLDRDVLLTDANRKPEDYAKMGLRTKKHSLHYKQSNGYAHAVDIRTKGHSALRNLLVENYFKLMGFNTLRHDGTADHLHVSLKSHDRPNSI